jgi:predicted choloylglycine hydrolase
MIDCLWGVLDGVNEHGLCVALAFAGRRVVGEGFGIPLLLRYALQSCADVPSAVRALSSLPTHMSYHVTLLDAAGNSGRLSLAPDRAATFADVRVTTNHGEAIEWPEHAKATHSVERGRVLERALADPTEHLPRLIGRFLRPPVFQFEYRRGFGTLYTAVYRSQARSLELMWPDAAWQLVLDAFEPGERIVEFPEVSRA